MDGEPVTSGVGGGGGAWPRMWEVFHGAVEREGESRAAYMAAECGADGALRTRVERLLAAHRRAGAGGLLEPAARPSAFAFGGADGQPPGEGEGPPTRIGNYVIRERIGEGGFAEVFLATQTEPVRRDVAVKLLRSGVGAGRVIERFDAERQTLAVLHHPNIATIFDAGVAENGRPYFVMEHIAGRPVTRYSDDQALGIDRRLALFERLCAAVQHAHHKGIIHRDLKPSNVLVTEVDGAPTVKVIDFGIARAIDPAERATGRGEAETIAGTPGYMSPEQAETGDVDTRTDVFSLGVMLYELLTGAPPFDAPAAVSATLERARVTRLKDPTPPSDRVRGGTPDAARRRGLAPPALARRLRGDLDAIVLKSLERDRARRYGSPAELAADIARHLAHEPVWAVPATRAYRAAKFVRRHRAGVAMAGVLLILGAAGVGLLIDTARTEKRLRADAVKAQAGAERDARIAQAVNEFLTADIIGAGDPRRAATPDLLLRDAIDAAEAKVGERFKDEPVVEAAVRQVLGDTFRSMGKFDKAATNLERAVALFNEHLGEENLRSLEASNHLAIVYTRLGRAAEAEPLYQRGIVIHTKLLGPDDRRTIHSMVNLGTLYATMGRHADAEKSLREGLDAARRALGPDDPDTLLIVQHLAKAYMALRRHADAEPLLRAAWEHEKTSRGDDHPYTVAAMGNLATALLELGRLDEAEPLHRAALEACIRRQGDAHVETAMARVQLAQFYVRSKRYADAEPLFLAGLERIHAALGDGHLTICQVHALLGEMYDQWSRPADAEPHHARAADGGRRVLPETAWQRGMHLLNHGRCLSVLGRHADAEERLLEGRRILEATLGPRHRHTREALRCLGVAYDGLSRPEEAEKYRALLAEAQKP